MQYSQFSNLSLVEGNVVLGEQLRAGWQVLFENGQKSIREIVSIRHFFFKKNTNLVYYVAENPSEPGVVAIGVIPWCLLVVVDLVASAGLE